MFTRNFKVVNWWKKIALKDQNLNEIVFRLKFNEIVVYDEKSGEDFWSVGESWLRKPQKVDFKSFARKALTCKLQTILFSEFPFYMRFLTVWSSLWRVERQLGT